MYRQPIINKMLNNSDIQYMKKIIYIVFALLLTLSVQAQIDRSVQPKPGPAPSVNLGKPKSFELPNGLKVLVVENHKLPRVSFTLTMDNTPSLEGNIKGVDDLASSMMGNGTSKISKDDFNDKIEYFGANVFFSTHNAGGSTLSRYFEDVLTLVAEGVTDPLFTQDELDNERAKLLDGLKADEKNIKSIATRVRNVLLYGRNHPKGEYLSEETINKVTLNDIHNYYQKYCIPTNAYLVIVGDVKFDEVKKLVTKNFTSWKKAPNPQSVYSEPKNLTATEIDFVDVPTAVQSEIAICNITNLKMTDPDYFPVIIANQILGGSSQAYLFMNLREEHGWTYGSYSRISGDKYTSNFIANAAVRNAVTDSAVVEMMKEINRIGTSLATQDNLDLAKARYVGNFVMNAEKPQTIASFALREKTQSLPSDFYENYIKNINAVTLQQVQDAAKKYFQHDVARIVIAGKASEVLPSLEKLNIPINYFDQYGNPVTKPEQQTVSADVTPQSILQKYIEVIGGQTALSNIKTIATTANASIQGTTITQTQKKTAEGKLLQEMSAMGMTMMKIVYNGKTGYMMVQGQKKDMEQTELEDFKYSVPFPELLFLNTDIKLKGIEDNAYILELGSNSYYYDVNTGLKVAEAATKSMNGQTINQKVNFSDYREVNGIKIPYVTSMSMGGMDIEMKVSDVKINEGVNNSDFE